MARRSDESPLETLMYLPWWVSLVLLIVGNIGIRMIIPAYFHENTSKGLMGGMLSGAVEGAMPFIANMFTMVMVVALGLSLFREFMQKRRQKAYDTMPEYNGSRRQSNPEPAFIPGSAQRRTAVNHEISPYLRSETHKPTKLTQLLLNEIEWKRFETLCAAAIHELGLDPKETKYGADGGIDIVVYKVGVDGPVGIVQCKAGENRIVGVKHIRELLGVMAHGNYKQAMFMTTGEYTQEAIDFAKGKITLVTGEMLINKINSMPQDKLQHLLDVAFEGDYRTPTCPQCGVKMVLRQASTGKNAGSNFWGCVHYPKCRQTLICNRTN